MLRDEVVAIAGKHAWEWLDAQCSEHMMPQAEHFDREDCREMLRHDDDAPESEGWYSRLTAPGYLDCTEWSGPFETEAEAYVHLYDTYAD